MGLLEHINSVYKSQKSQQEGLLSLAEKLRANNLTETEVENNTTDKSGLLSQAEKLREKPISEEEPKKEESLDNVFSEVDELQENDLESMISDSLVEMYKNVDRDKINNYKPIFLSAMLACFLTGVEYKEEYDRAYIDQLLEKLTALGCKNIIFTGISYAEGKTGVVVFENGEYSYYEHDKLGKGCHGTGDVYASAFVGAFMRGKSAYDAAKIAADYAVECIKETAKLDNHWYGAAFEPVIGKLIAAINE